MPPEELKELLKKPLVATGAVSLVAEKDAEGKPIEGNKKMTITAYNGGLMNVAWGYPVGIELSGLKWREDNAVPILCQHKTYSIDAICGQGTKVSHNGKTLIIDADFMPVSQDAKKVYDLAKAGFKFQASVGVSASDVIFIDANQSYKLNGAEVKGECYIVRAGVLNEVSIVPLGADGSTQTAIAAAANQGKEGAMPDKKNMAEAEPADTATVEAAQKAERERVASVIAACKGHEDIMAQAVNEGWTAEKAELACLKAEKAAAEKTKELAKIQAGRAEAPSIIDLKASAPKDAKTVVAAACMGAAMSDDKVEATCKGVDLDAAHDLAITDEGPLFVHRTYNDAGEIVSRSEPAISAADSTIIAVSQRAKDKLSSTTIGLDSNERGLLEVDESGRTTRLGVFAGGDVTLGPFNVVQAVKSARHVAEAMSEYLREKAREE